ncbi:RNA polymerase sigma-70 factor (ECF subfamily) [Pedobacter sp. AK017]|uniref:RNA polymerase sigma-70 factor n=1 Tax=Pedobacter sp. AK017 TaxID=2723073 RepID=UPI001615546D|nr:RNA polymerase sigma-70 factor [Pedobacter sp. AK017]MBB5436925.1 RNA polymerase sigma-70 factor (ECF subfamily) [Pedobacter sp. AK017]
MQEFDQLADEELSVLLQADSHGAFTEIYHRYKGILVIHASKKLGGDIEDSKEIIQEVFSKLWSNRHALPLIKNLKAYLYTLVRNSVLNQIQHQQVVTKYADSFAKFVPEHQYSTDGLIREKQMMEIIDKEIEALPPKMKEVFLSSRKSNLSHKEIAEKLEISEFTVKNHIKSALKILRTRLDLAFIIILLRHY